MLKVVEKYISILCNIKKQLQLTKYFIYFSASQTRNYSNWSQDYGGFIYLNDKQKQEILDLTFSFENGLRPGLIKMFIDPFHEGWTINDNDNNDPFNINMSGYDHTTTTKNMRYFIGNGLNITSSWTNNNYTDDYISIILGLYGPAPWLTWQKFIRGRDLDPSLFYETGEYLVSFAKYLIENESIKYPIKWISFHNEGENYNRWPLNGTTPGPIYSDYDVWFPPQHLINFLSWMPQMLEKQNMSKYNIGLTTGETSNWFRFQHYGYPQQLIKNKTALNNLGLITSHGFVTCTAGNNYGDIRSFGIDLLRENHINGNNLHAWVTSDTWKFMDSSWGLLIIRSILSEKINGYIPWAIIWSPDQHLGGIDGNDLFAPFTVYKNGTYVITKGYYYFKQFCRAGQPKMNVIMDVYSDITTIYILAFGKGENNIDAIQDNFIIVSTDTQSHKVRITIVGTIIKIFDLYRTSDNGENYEYISTMNVTHDLNVMYIDYTVPPSSISTFFGQK